MFLLSLINIASLHLNVSFQTFLLKKCQKSFTSVFDSDHFANHALTETRQAGISSCSGEHAATGSCEHLDLLLCTSITKKAQQPCREAEAALSWQEEELH